MKKIYIIRFLCFVIVLILIVYFFVLSLPQKVSKSYSAVVVNIKTNELIETTTIRVSGESKNSIPILRKRGHFKGRISTDYINKTNDDNYQMIDIIFSTNPNMNSFYSPLNYYSYDISTQTQDLAGIGYINSNNCNMDKIVISLYPKNVINGGLTDECIIAPAANLDEALKIYHELMY